ncbi:MAG: MerR family transcriptional regulator [Xenococcus sp. MO_188.B8]|nr:MerR family transcriptional regulator [Xenococcus sp. MO_188.B8]
MGEKFFTSKQAAKIIGCSLRQLQYWRDKGVVVPTIEGSGTGRSIYYSQSDLVQLAIMEYLLSVGLSFATASWGLKELIKTDVDFANPETKKRWMLLWDKKTRSLVLEAFDREKAIASLDKGQPMIPLWLDLIHQQLKT